jgi:hypothetical protein
MVQSKRVLLHTTALCLGLAAPLVLSSQPAEASCTSTAPPSNTTVTCTGSSTTGITANSSTSNVTVILEDGATVNTTNNSIALSGSGNTVQLDGSSSISSSGGTAISLGTSSATGNYIILNDDSSISAAYFAITLQGSLGGITLNDYSSLITSGSSSAIVVNGSNNSIILNDSSTIKTTGTTAAHGIWLISGGNTVTISSGASIDAKGFAINGSNGSDTVENFGTLIGNVGTAISLNGGDDYLTLGTGSSITGAINGGDGTDDLTLVGSGSEDSDFLNFETLIMNGSDWTLSGHSDFGSYNSIYLNSGILTNAGTLKAGGLIFGDTGGATFRNEGSFIGAVAGSSGADSLKNYGIITGLIVLGAGDDVVILGTGSTINGNLNGGSGSDAVTLVGSGSEDSTFSNFETLTMNGTNWTLSGTSSFNSVYINSGQLKVTAGLSFSSSGILENHAALIADITGSSGSDTVKNYGTITGAINPGDGDDDLMLGTGSAITGSIDGGTGSDDLTLVGSGSEDSDFTNFETLTMIGTDWALWGESSFVTVNLNSGSFTNAGVLAATGGLNFAAGGANLTNSGMLAANITGSSGGDTVKNYGTIIGAIDLGDGDDGLTLGSGSSISGNIDGGDGTDDLTLVDSGSEDSNIGNFETLAMSGTDWALWGESSFDTITVSSGILRVNGDISGDMTVTSAGELAGTGTLNGNVVSSGITAPGNSVGMLTINGTFTQTGGSFEVEFDDTGNADLLWVTGDVILDGPRLNVSALNGATSVYDVIVHSDTSIGGTGFGPIVYDGDGAASVRQIGNDLYLLVVDSTAVGAVNVAALQMGLNAFDQFGSDLADACEEAGAGNRWQMSTGQNCRGRLWVRSFGQMADEEVGKDGQDFSYRQTGVAIGGDGAVAEGFRLGGSLGTTLGDEEIASKGGESTSEGILGMLYGTVRRAGAFLSAAIDGGYQRYELTRKASVMGALITAEADTEGVQLGGRVETGAEIGLPQDWVVTPRASALYVHHRIGGYRESGDNGGAAMDDHNTGSLRLKAEVTAAQRYEADSVVYRPHVKVGVLADILPGNEVEGSFIGSGDRFALPLSKGERFRALGGIGLEARFAAGSIAELSYEGEAGSDSVAHALTATVRFDW